jgi:hypothetical protein
MKRALVVASLLLVAGPAAADVVFLHGGGQIRGEIVEHRADSVVLEVGPGRVTLPMSRVERIVAGATPLSEYRARAAMLSPRDADGWLNLARWAESRSLLTQAREAYERVLSLDPNNGVARAGLGHVHFGGRWLSEPEAKRALGLVEFEGAWISPRERVAILSERAALAQEHQEAREAEARIRAAEADARRAEAEARRAEAEAEQASVDAGAMGGGIPYPWIFDPPYGGAIIIPGPIVTGPMQPHSPHSRGHRTRRGGPDPPTAPAPPPPRKPQRDNAGRRDGSTTSEKHSNEGSR